MAKFMQILCLIDFNDHNEDIYYYVKELAEKETEILLVHVEVTERVLGSLEPNFFGKKFQKEANTLESQLQEVAKVSFPQYKCHVATINGSVDKALNELVDTYCADVIVMGSVSAKGIRKWFSEDYFVSIVAKSRIPVFVVPNDLNLECIPAEV